jgi:predicted aspartyl protease
MRLIPAALGVVALASAPGPVTVPFVWTPGQIEVAVAVNGAPATFLLDTGSEYSIVSTRLARQLSLGVESGGARDFAGGVTLAVGPITMADQRVMVMPFDTYYARGRRIDGLLGFDVFDRFAVKIDWSGKTLTFWDRGAFTPPKAAMDVPIEFAGRLPVVTAVLQLESGSPLTARLMVDTGASQSVMLRQPFAVKHDLFARAAGEKSAPSLADGTRRLVVVPARDMAVGPLTFDRPEILAFAESIGSAGSTATDGLIGNTLLSRFTLYVDYARKKLYLEPLRR